MSENQNVPYIVWENDSARWERNSRRKTVVIIILMAILTNEAMEDSEGGYSERYSRDGEPDGRTSHGRMYYGGGSYPRYYSYAKRDGRGRYSRDGYSYADAKSDMIAELKELAKKAPDDKTKQEIEHFANEMESK